MFFANLLWPVYAPFQISSDIIVGLHLINCHDLQSILDYNHRYNHYLFLHNTFSSLEVYIYQFSNMQSELFLENISSILAWVVKSFLPKSETSLLL